MAGPVGHPRPLGTAPASRTRVQLWGRSGEPADFQAQGGGKGPTGHGRVGGAAIGEEEEAEQDVMTLRGRINDLTHSGEGELADALRPLYIDYLLKRAG